MAANMGAELGFAAEVMQKKTWHVGMCRTDVWEAIPKSFTPAHEVVKSLGAWTQGG